MPNNGQRTPGNPNGGTNRNPHATGQPTKCTPETMAKMKECQLLGMSIANSCTHAGISQASHHAWIERATEELAHIANGGKPRQREQPYVEYLEQFRLGQSGFERQNAGIIARAAQPHPVETRTIKRDALVIRGVVQRDPAGNPIMVETTTVTTRMEFDWRAAETLLKRRMLDVWGDNAKIEHRGDVGVRTAVPEQPVDAEVVAELTAVFEEIGLRLAAEAEGEGEG